MNIRSINHHPLATLRYARGSEKHEVIMFYIISSLGIIIALAFAIIASLKADKYCSD